jgi:glutamyl-tRNA reductase
MFCISVSFKKTPLDIRQQFAFSQEEQIAFLCYLMKNKIITGGVIVSTCNRSELYFTGDFKAITKIEEKVSAFKKITREEIKKYCLFYKGEQAVKHLYKVSCGLDSMVLGEDEILRQVKEAYLLSDKSGFTNSEINVIFQGAFNCAKQSKSETRLSNTPVSLGTLTANAVQEYLNNTKQKEKTVLVIGASGKIGSIVAKNLVSKNITVIGTRRSKAHGDGMLCQETEGMKWINFDNRYEAALNAAVIVSATTSPHYTITRDEFMKCRAVRECLLIDLAVPYDIDKDIGSEEGITLYDIDYFRTLSKENGNIKLGELEKAESIILECVEEVLKKLYLREFQEKMADRYEEDWFQKMTFYLRDVLDSRQLKKVLDKIYYNETNEVK